MPILSPISEAKVAKCPRMSQLNDIAEEGVAMEWKGGIVYTSLNQYRGDMYCNMTTGHCLQDTAVKIQVSAGGYTTQLTC